MAENEKIIRIEKEILSLEEQLENIMSAQKADENERKELGDVAQKILNIKDKISQDETKYQKDLNENENKYNEKRNEIKDSINNFQLSNDDINDIKAKIADSGVDINNPQVRVSLAAEIEKFKEKKKGEEEDKKIREAYNNNKEKEEKIKTEYNGIKNKNDDDYNDSLQNKLKASEIDNRIESRKNEIEQIEIKIQNFKEDINSEKTRDKNQNLNNIQNPKDEGGKMAENEGKQVSEPKNSASDSENVNLPEAEKPTPPAGFENIDFNNYLLNRGLSLDQTRERKAELWSDFLASKETPKEQQASEAEKNNTGNQSETEKSEIETPKTENNEELSVSDSNKEELSVSDSNKEEISVSDSNQEEMSVDDEKDAPAAESKDKPLKKIDIKRKDGLDHPEEEEEEKGPFKEGDIIDYMYNEWMIALANKIYVKAGKKIKSWGESAYISFLQGLEDRQRKAAENRKDKKPKTTDTIDYYSKVERNTTGVMNKRIDTMNKSFDKLTGAYEKISQGDFSVFDNLPKVQKEMMLKRFNSLKEGKFPEEEMKKFSPEQQAEMLKKVKENGGNPLKVFCKEKIDDLNQRKNNFKLVNEIAANYVCSKLGDAKIVDKDFDPKVAGLEEKYHLMAVESILRRLDEVDAHNKDPKNKDNQKDSIKFLEDLSKNAADAKKHTDKQIMRDLVAEHNIKQPYDSKTADKKGKPLDLENGSKSIPLAKNKDRSKTEETLKTDVYGREEKDKEKTPIGLYEAFSKNILKDEQISETLSYLTLGEQRITAREEERKSVKELAKKDRKPEKTSENAENNNKPNATENKEKPNATSNSRVAKVLANNKNKYHG